MRQVLVISLALLVVTLSAASVAGAREIQKRVPMLHEPATQAAPSGTVFGVSQVPTDTFYYGGTVWDATDGRWEAAEPTAAGWANRKMWTWSASGFGGTSHSGRNMDGWAGFDNSVQSADHFKVQSTGEIGACVVDGNKSLFCGKTSSECVQQCYVNTNGTGYGTNWNQIVVTPSFHYSAGNEITLTYDVANESEDGYDFTYLWLQTYDTVTESWVEYPSWLARYHGVVSGAAVIDLDSYLSGIAGDIDFRIKFQFQSDGSWSDKDGWYPTVCGAVAIDNVVLSGDVSFSEDFEGVTVGERPAGWEKIVEGVGDFARAEHLSNVPVGLEEDPCVVAVPGMCEIADSVLVLYDPDSPGYPHPHGQHNYIISPVIELVGHAGLPGKSLQFERFASLPLDDHVFIYWRVRYRPYCEAGGWSDWLSDDYLYYTREGTSCATFAVDVSSYLPPDAPEVQIAMGVVNLCQADPWSWGCSYVCNATPYFDNATLAAFGADGAPHISVSECQYWQDQFAEDGTLNPASTADTRIACWLSDLNPPIFGDTLICRSSADNVEVCFVFRMPKIGPRQSTTDPFFTTWFPGVTGGLWCEARMDTGEVTDASGTATLPVSGAWMCAFHEDDPIRIANGLSELTEILPNNLFTPGARIEYFLKARYSGSSDWFLLPDTTGGVYEEFEILPMMRDECPTETGIGWPCLLVVDHFGQRGNWGERNSDRIIRHLKAGGYDFDVYNKLAPTSDARNGIGRWPANPGQIGGPGTSKYNWGPGATAQQLYRYTHCIVNTGNVYGNSLYQQDVDVLSIWLNWSSYYNPRFLWVSGDQVCRELNRRSPWGPQFLNNMLCASLTAGVYNTHSGDNSYCLPMNGITGGRIDGGDPESYVVRSQVCPRHTGGLSVIGVFGESGCNAVAEVEYNPGHDEITDVAAVSNAVSVPCGKYYKTFTEGYDFCLIRTDDSQGPLACGTDGFLSAWLDSVLAWGDYDPPSCCGEPGLIAPPSWEYSTAEWRNPVCNGAKVFVCPACSGVQPPDTCLSSWLHISVRDLFNHPMVGMEVCVNFENPTCDTILCSPVTGITVGNGELDLNIGAGLDVSGDTACCTVISSVEVWGITIHRDTLEWLSPDMNADGIVDGQDTLIFKSDWLSNACRSDFNCDGIVDPLDWNILMTHYGHYCNSGIIGVAGVPRMNVRVTGLSQNYPNPFNPLTGIEFSVKKPGRIALRVYNIAGRLVRTLVDAHREPGSYSEPWDGRAEDGTELPSGVYFYRLEAGDFVATRKMVLLR